MKRAHDGGRTFETIRARYDTWAANRPPKPVADDDWSPRGPEPGLSMGRLIPLAIGVGVGGLLLILAALSLWAAASWSGYDREPATIGFTVAGIFLIVAGVGGILATVKHMLRVLDPDRRVSHGHH
jgi:hypothetical protein